MVIFIAVLLALSLTLGGTLLAYFTTQIFCTTALMCVLSDIHDTSRMLPIKFFTLS